MKGNRRATIDKDHLYCPTCLKDYSKTNLVQRFDKSGNVNWMLLVCDCKRKLGLRFLTNGWFKLYDVTEQQIQKNERAKAKRKLLKYATNN